MEVVAIHPFQEGNGRTARLLMNAIVMRYVTGPSSPLIFTLERKDRYKRCVQEHRMGQPEGLQALTTEMLEELAEEREGARLGVRIKRRLLKRGGRLS
jgi:Fic family protein